MEKTFRLATSPKRSREIMGKNFFGLEEIFSHFVARITKKKKQFAALSEVPFSEAVLEELKDTHILIAVLPFSILEIRSKVASSLFLSHEGAWYNKKSFAKKHGQTKWQLVRKTEVANSTSKSWREQQVLLSKDEEVPTAQVMVYTIIGHYLATGEHLFKNTNVRTSSVVSNGGHVGVCYIDSIDSIPPRIGININTFSDRTHLGIASARKF
ncbi:MAG: hypothetical protein NTU58_00305 [Candidatus Nealsonbacteria bacterium]|nr:hypothetical protein [Candidatus Nealsonbacteria bacterium]